MEDHSDLRDALACIDPAGLDYTEWVTVGMALKESGLPFEVWDEWSSRDARRYRGDGGMRRKWEGFGSAPGARVGSGTVARMAMERGWDPHGAPDEALDWGFEVTYMGEPSPGRFIDSSWVEPAYIESPDDSGWDPVGELSAYISALFDEGEYVGYVTESWEKDGRWMPTKGVYALTAGDILRALAGCGGDLGAAIGDCNPQAGAWIRFNPLNGRGVRNSDVTDYRYALVECDTIPKEMQLSLIRELELPCAAVVDSGNKSVHAIVHIDAADYAEYRKRVDQLYDVCKKNGLALDTQNKNPARLSRMPGVARGGSKQHLVAVGCGKESWAEWWEWVQEANDDLPDPELLSDTWGRMDPAAPELIEGILRQGHKMLLAGPSKAGKSFALIELCIAIAEGRKWLGRQCAQGRVLYVNLELDARSCRLRFADMYDAMQIPPDNVGNISIWNLRGRALPLDALVPKLVRRAQRSRPIAVVIDPIYKVITGDENSASEMALFCNQFDAITDRLGCAAIYCHHFSKGDQGQKKAQDRASGSGVFARDPDAQLTMTQLQLGDEALGLARDEGGMTAWRVEAALREFPPMEPFNVWFRYPLHVNDWTGLLRHCDLEGSMEAAKKRSMESKKRKATEDWATRNALIADALALCEEDAVEPTKKNVLERIGEFDGKAVTIGQLEKWAKDGEERSEYAMFLTRSGGPSLVRKKATSEDD